MKRDPEACMNPERVATAVHEWSGRKRRTLKKEHILAAWKRLTGQGWSESFVNE